MPDSTGRRIARRRHVLRMNQRQLAEKVGVSRNTVSLWENDEMFPHNHLGALEAVLGINLLPNGPEIDPHVRAVLAGLSPEERAILIEEWTEPPTAPRSPRAHPGRERREGGGRHRAAM